QRLSQAASDSERESAFDSSAVTQFEYTYDPTLYPGTDLYYDVSDINDAFPRQFCDYGVALKPDRSECPSVLCPPDCQKNCSAVYNYYNDDFATHGCDSHASLTLFLCQGD
ncbi:BYS1 domain-containing protein, partial [Thelonectria olida]